MAFQKNQFKVIHILKKRSMETREHAYQAGSTACKGYFAYPTAVEKPPIVVIVSTWEGMNKFAHDQAHEIVNMGYGAFIADIFGGGKSASTSEEAASLTLPLFENRALLRERIIAAYLEAKKMPECDGSKIAAIGFCFGGLTVIELMKSGALLNGVASFHGVLGTQMMGHTAHLAKTAGQIQSSFLLFHGYKDPLTPMEDVLELQKELSEKNVDWQTHIYGTAAHSFTNPDAHDTSSGMYFDKNACHRSMKTLHNYLKEIFQ